MINNTTKGYVEYLHLFRGFAIACIVGAHAWSFPTLVYGTAKNFDGHIYLYSFTEMLFHGSTLYFALISGVLFGHVLGRRPWKAFFRSKLLNVLVPYIIISILFTMITWFSSSGSDAVQAEPMVFISSVFENIVYGKAQGHLWYLPILVLLFVITPLLKWCYQTFPRAYLLFSLLPLIFSRTVWPDLLSVNSFFYFLGAYAIGIWFGGNLEFAMQQAKKYRAQLAVVAALTSAVVAVLIFNRYPSNQGYSWLQSAIYFQKMSISLLVVLWLESFAASNRYVGLKAIFSRLGTYSFTIYFLHVLVIYTLSEQLKYLVPDLSLAGLSVVGLGMLVVGLTLPMVAGKPIKMTFGRRARWVIGA